MKGVRGILIRQNDTIYSDSLIICIFCDTFHAVVTYFRWVKITTVTFAAMNAFTII